MLFVLDILRNQISFLRKQKMKKGVTNYQTQQIRIRVMLLTTALK